MPFEGHRDFVLRKKLLDCGDSLRGQDMLPIFVRHGTGHGGHLAIGFANVGMEILAHLVLHQEIVVRRSVFDHLQYILAVLGHVQLAFATDQHAGHGDVVAFAGRGAGGHDDGGKNSSEEE